MKPQNPTNTDCRHLLPVNCDWRKRCYLVSIPSAGIWIWEYGDMGLKSSSSKQRSISDRFSGHHFASISGGLLILFMPLYVYENERWENTGLSIEKRKFELLINNRTPVGMPSSILLSVLVPLPSGNLVFWPLWISIIFLNVLSLGYLLICCDKCCSVCLGKLLPTHLPSPLPNPRLLINLIHDLL